MLRKKTLRFNDEKPPKFKERQRGKPWISIFVSLMKNLPSLLGWGRKTELFIEDYKSRVKLLKCLLSTPKRAERLLG